MATKNLDDPEKTNGHDDDDEPSTSKNVEKRNADECAICLLPYNLPVEITCGHRFCFLCIKGVCARNSRCPLCRRPVAADYFFQPKALATDEIKSIVAAPRSDQDSVKQESSSSTIGDPESSVPIDNKSPSKAQSSTEAPPEAPRWFYEGRNGWWRYDDRTSTFVEEAYSRAPSDSPPDDIEATISGYVYVIDFRRMIQYRKDEPSRRRRIKRVPPDSDDDDDSSVEQAVVKGIAGLKLTNLGGAIRDGAEKGSL